MVRLPCAILAVLLCSSCAPAPLPAGEEASAPRVVSLNPCTDAILAEVADARQILAISHYSHDPHATSMDLDHARRFRATGGSVEEVLALKPDLVIGSTFTDPATRAAYARLGIRFEAMGIAGTVEQSRAQVRRIAALVGHAERGEALVTRIDAALARAAPPPGTAPLPAVIWQADGMVPGEQALIVQLMEAAGLANFAGQQGLGQADRLSLEQLLANPPQVLLVVADGEDRQRFHPALRHLTGTARYRLDPRLVYCGGPTIIAAARRLSAIREQAR